MPSSVFHPSVIYLPLYVVTLVLGLGWILNINKNKCWIRTTSATCRMNISQFVWTLNKEYEPISGALILSLRHLELHWSSNCHIQVHLGLRLDGGVPLTSPLYWQLHAGIMHHASCVRYPSSALTYEINMNVICWTSRRDISSLPLPTIPVQLSVLTSYYT